MLSYYAFTHDLSVHNIIGSLTKQRVLSTLTSTNFQNPNPTANDFAYPHKGAISNTTTPNEKKHPTTCTSLVIEFFNSQNEQFKSRCEHLNTQMTTLHDLIAQAMQKKEEEKRIAEEQAAKERYWKIPICDDDDD
ncbi:hypothetical protein Tco_0955666 [Tanacetum coccineum]|uniref:Uncharacterized protein n=1 Tax=Tanacetum coccineum TaxID=301880 RepID=A0ABQ5E7U2_9ASTR